MTIEIKQLVIRAIVEDRRRAAPAALPHEAPAVDAGTDREAVIAECTRRVLRELRRERGR